jgi:replicative DNA helicase
MSENRALLLGWILGDGHLGGSVAVTVSCEADARVVADLAEQEFGLRPIIKPERPGTPALRVILTTGKMCGAGKNPLTTWLRRLGLWKCTGATKFVPTEVFRQSNEVTAAFLRGLFHADGSFTARQDSTRATVRFVSISEALVRAASSLLLRLGINSIVKCDSQNIGGFRTTTKCLWTLSLLQRGAICDFMDTVGFVGEKHERAVSKLIRSKENDATQFDRIPLEINGRLREIKELRGLSHEAMGWREQGKMMSRSTCAALAERLNDTTLEALAFSDVLWEPIVSIEDDGYDMTYDLSVEDLHNFCVDDFITHNSGAIEQEADMVTFLYRDAYYNPESAVEADLTEFIIAKSRNGPTGTVKLRFLKEHTLFVPYGDAGHYAPP